MCTKCRKGKQDLHKMENQYYGSGKTITQSITVNGVWILQNMSLKICA